MTHFADYLGRVKIDQLHTVVMIIPHVLQIHRSQKRYKWAIISWHLNQGPENWQYCIDINTPINSAYCFIAVLISDQFSTPSLSTAAWQWIKRHRYPEGKKTGVFLPQAVHQVLISAPVQQAGSWWMSQAGGILSSNCRVSVIIWNEYLQHSFSTRLS